jgi:hypothetical protein
MADIICPNCGMPNSPEQNACSFCNQPLKSSEKIRPGEAPTKKTTAELEAVLPEWLREARASARNVERLENPAATFQPEPEKPAPKKEEPFDLLAGLASAADEDQDDELPAWMRGAAPSHPPTTPAKPEPTEQAFIRRQELRWDDENTADELGGMATTPIPSAPESDDAMLPWMRGEEKESDEEKSSTPSWLDKQPQPKTPISPFNEGSFRPPSTSELTNWIDKTRADLEQPATSPKAESDDSLGDWLSNLSREEFPSAPAESNETFQTGIDLPAWISPAAGPFNAPAETAAPSSEPASEDAISFDLPDWMKPAAAAAPFTAPAETAAPSSEPTLNDSSSFDLPDWMKPAAATPFPAPAETAAPFSEPPQDDSSSFDLPDWMKPAPGPFAVTDKTAEPPAAPKEEVSPFSLPDWNSSPVNPFTVPAETAGAASDNQWMNSLLGQETPAETPKAAPTPEVPRAPAFVPTQESLSGEQMDDLFSADMPDWLSNIAPTEQTSEPAQGEAERASIAPADLPSWVQAMRPVESALDAQATRPLPAGPVEEQGPLAGLRDVLPLEGLIQPGKPKAYAIRVQMNDAQQSDATLLDQILAAETQAQPLGASGKLFSQRVLRWVISALMILLVSFLLISGSRLVPLPVTIPEESSRILSMLETLPNDAPVLMIFDYEPALAGELEAAAAPLVDRVLGLRNPRVTILSTSPTGAVLAERFFAKTQTRHNYQSEQNYINLGYLPGGTLGILSFAENPRMALPSPLWTTPPAQDVNHLADYAAIILLTDQSETARAWVEQTASHLEGRPLLVISSAQAAPMIQPYLYSGQVNALVSGLHDGAAFESTSGMESPVRVYWDTYNLALLFVAVFIIIGGLWNWIAGVRARRQNLGEF